MAHSFDSRQYYGRWSEHRLVSTFSTNKLFCWCYISCSTKFAKRSFFLSENIILVGIIPCEPSKVINTTLEPLVDDLLKLWEGVLMKSPMDNTILVRAALICVS